MSEKEAMREDGLSPELPENQGSEAVAGEADVSSAGVIDEEKAVGEVILPAKKKRKKAESPPDEESSEPEIPAPVPDPSGPGEELPKEIIEENPLETSDSQAQHNDEEKSVSDVDEKSETGLPSLNLDYIRHNKQELVEAARNLLLLRSVQETATDLENIRSVFYKKHNLELAEKKKHFLDEGGLETDFVPLPDPLEEEFKELFEEFRVRRNEFFRAQEAEKTTNLEKKLAIIEQIKNLVNTQESMNKTFNEFRDLQRLWRETGPVPQSELHSLWESYHHNVEVFYDYIKINKELRDLDLKKNMEIKIQICEQAEQLLLEPSVVKAFNELQTFHTEWREVGPVPREKRDELWDRFKEATNQINRKHQEFYQTLKDEQKKNLDAKTELCEKIEEINTKEIATPKDWNEYSREVVNLQKIWRSIGFAPRKDNNRIYDRFRKGCDQFFDRKRHYFSSHRDVQQENLQLKTDLCMQAEALMSSTEWRKTTEDLINIQRKWKEIGPVPRRYSDALWKRFRSACDTFFQRRSEHVDNQDNQQVDNLKAKEALVERVKSFEFSQDQNHDLSILKQIQKEFTEIGHVPVNRKDEVNRMFREAIHQLFDQLEIDDSKKEILRFREKIDNLAQSPKGNSRMQAEREKLAVKLKQLETDIVLWENNVGFFSKSEKSESLIREVQSRIEQSHERIKILKQKIDLIDRSDS